MNSSKPSTPVSSPKAQKALSIVVQEPRPQPTTPPPPAQKRQTTFSSRQTKRSSSSFLNTPEPQQQSSQQSSQLSVSGVRDKELNLDSQIPSLPYTPSSKRRSYGIFESPVGRSPYGVALRTPRNEDHDSPEQRSKRYGIVGRDNDGDDDDDNEYEDEETRHNYTPMGGVGDDEDEESRRLKLQKTPQFHSAKRLYDTLNSVMINNQNSAHNRYMNGIINSGNGQSINESTTNDSGSNIINKSPNLKTNRHLWSANVNLQFSPPKAPLPPPPQYQQHKLPPPPPPPPPQPKFTPLTTSNRQPQNQEGQFSPPPPPQQQSQQQPTTPRSSWSISSTPMGVGIASSLISPVYLPPQSSPTKLIIEPNDEEVSAKDAIRKIIQKKRHSGTTSKTNPRTTTTTTTTTTNNNNNADTVAAAAMTLNFKSGGHGNSKHNRNNSYSIKDETEAAFSLVKLQTAAGDDGDDTEDETEDDKE
ncbi:hypothetical protein W5O_05660 [Candida albicans Ca6]|nr:hypothetical protein W5O_05660 [Candida albicans Ca6]